MGATILHEWDIYFLAGVASTRSIFTECIRELQRRYEESGYVSRIRELYPYGDHTQNIYLQLLKVGNDLYSLRKSVQTGARAVAEQVRYISFGRPVLFIGHSGGGVAAYKAAVLLNQESVIPDWRVVQIGSPKQRIHHHFADKVHYFVAVNEEGACTDYITRLGSWGGFSRNRKGLPYWDRMKHAPKEIVPILTLGGHQHYFRKEAPYVHPERGSNLQMVTDMIWKYVARELAPSR